jgi:hypothetical protein
MVKVDCDLVYHPVFTTECNVQASGRDVTLPNRHL